MRIPCFTCFISSLMYVVHRQTTICFKHLILTLYYWVECSQTSKEWSLGCLLSTVLKEFNFMQTFDCHGKTFDCHGGNQMKSLKKLLSKTIGQIPNTFGRNDPCVALYQNYSNYRLKT